MYPVRVRLVREDLGPCVEWTAGTNGVGYGIMKFDGKKALVHRVAFFSRYGHWPPVVRHKCDNPPCFNTDHLTGGTKADNSRDMVERGRNPWTGAKLDWDSVRTIRAEADSRAGYAEIAQKYEVSKTTIGRILRGESWRE